jgi:Na+-translocating ferredoxin:NAD+ oxidoreductase RnfG subunit
LTQSWGKLIFIILAVISLACAGVYGATATEADFEQYLPELVPEASSFEVVDERLAEGEFLYIAKDAGTAPFGIVTIGTTQGYGGPMVVMVSWSTDGTILDVLVPIHNDTSAWYGKLAEVEYFAQFMGRSYSEPLLLDEDIDAVSGATKSSIGVDNGVREGRQLLSEYLGDPYPIPEEKVDFGLGEILLIVGLSSVAAFRTIPVLRNKKYLRYISLVFGLAVLGIWLSKPLSLINFIVWPMGYLPPWQHNLFVYILVFGVIGLALILAKNVWCFWLCPFNAIQEGAHFIAGGKVSPLSERHFLLRNARYVLLWGVVFLALLIRKPAVSVFEPWNNIFSMSGTMMEWLFVGIVIIGAILIYDLWCHYLCPVGATMDIVLGVRNWISDTTKRVFSR